MSRPKLTSSDTSSATTGPGLGATSSAVGHLTAPGQLTALSHPLPAGMRDLLPAEAEAQGRLSSRVLRTFDLHGYQQVSLPAFEYAEVLERGLGMIDPASLLRFVEPETGEVVALRPDMTPQVARLVATRLSDRPSPARLSYRGSVLRRQHERARHDQQMLQAGIELVGQEGVAADLEVVSVCIFAVQSAGLQRFVLDLGHGGIAQSLLAQLSAEARAHLLEALSLKDAAELARRGRALGLSDELFVAVTSLVQLSGGHEVFERARATLGQSAAWEAVEELRQLYEALIELLGHAGAVPPIVVDLGETRAAAYYTGPTFQILAEGPGRPVASGGRYDALYGAFGAERPAAGGAIQLDHLRWALGEADQLWRVRVVVAVQNDSDAEADAVRGILAKLRKAQIPCISCGSALALDYARAWRYSHVLCSKSDPTVVSVMQLSGEQQLDLGSAPLDEFVTKLSSS